MAHWVQRALEGAEGAETVKADGRLCHCVLCSLPNCGALHGSPLHLLRGRHRSMEASREADTGNLPYLEESWPQRTQQ